MTAHVMLLRALYEMCSHNYHTQLIQICVCLPHPSEAQICTNIALTSWPFRVMALETEERLKSHSQVTNSSLSALAEGQVQQNRGHQAQPTRSDTNKSDLCNTAVLCRPIEK
jgi:hypothetical protein